MGLASDQDDGSDALCLGYHLYARGSRTAEAEGAYRRAIAAGSAEAWLYLGLLLFTQRHRHDDAKTAFRAAMACEDPAIASCAAVMLGVMLDNLDNDQEGARACFEFALEQGTERAWEAATLGLAFVLAYAGDRQAATARFQSVIERRLQRCDVDLAPATVRRLATLFAALAHASWSRAVMRQWRMTLYRARRLRRRLLPVDFRSRVGRPA